MTARAEFLRLAALRENAVLELSEFHSRFQRSLIVDSEPGCDPRARLWWIDQDGNETIDTRTLTTAEQVREVFRWLDMGVEK